MQSLILPIVDYCDVLYDSFSLTNSTRLQRVFNNCLRFIFNCNRRQHVTPMLKQLSWLRLADRRSLHSLVLLHKLIYNTTTTPVYLTNKVSLLNSLRNGPVVQIPRHRTGYYGRTFFVRVAERWNQLPKEIRTTTSVKSFTSLLRQHYLQQY